MTTPSGDHLKALWQTDAEALYAPGRWPSFWRPRIIIKRGVISPWFWPPLWITRTGVFSLLFLVVVSDDILHCSAQRRRAILAHECGHIHGFHGLIWPAFAALVLQNSVLKSGFAWLAAFSGPWVALLALLGFTITALAGLRALLYWFEHQADDYAASKVSIDDLIEALTWFSKTLFGDKASPWINSRINRLRALNSK
jgi:Zn-dependent protease with chaperone function